MLKSFKGPGVRPTMDQVRESWFSILGARTVDARFLDLYAGTGSVGIEALSRGAVRCVFVEKTRQGVAVIRENLRVLGDLPADAVEVRTGDAVLAVPALERAGEVFDLVFADPPYEDLEAPAKILAAVAAAERLMAPGVLVTIQHARRVPLPEAVGLLVRRDERTYGNTTLTMYKVLEQ